MCERRELDTNDRICLLLRDTVTQRGSFDKGLAPTFLSFCLLFFLSGSISISINGVSTSREASQRLIGLPGWIGAVNTHWRLILLALQRFS